MHIPKRFSCFIIGEGTLPIQCAEILLRRGHEVCGVISPDASVNDWAKTRSIPHIEPTADLTTFMGQRPFDYLFSIVSGHILPKEVLELPRKYAISYHDSPLPRYAGAHATSWALMHGETIHAVTWHAMTDLVDAGDILKQRSVDIAPGETAFALNGKCYDAAINSFAELVDDLAYGRASMVKQNLDERTYFSPYKRPAAGCVLSWDQDVHDIEAFVRALDFGFYPNPLGLPKLAIERNFVIVPDIHVLNSISETPTGTITGIESDSLKVSTTNHEIELSKVLTIDGQPLSIPDLVAKYELHIGYRFSDVDRDMSRRITELNGSICKHEAFWVERLATLQPISLPYATRAASHGMPARYTSVSMPIPEEVTTFLRGRQAAWDIGDFLLAAFAIYLARIGRTFCFDIGFRGVELQRDLAGLDGFFASHVPLRVDISYERNFEEIVHALREEKRLVRQRKTYARDVMARYPVLHSAQGQWKEHTFPVILERVEGLDNYEAMPGSELTLVIPAHGAECLWVYDAAILDKVSIARMLRQFATLLRGIALNPDRRISDLPVLSEEERRQLLAEFNDTRADYPQNQCVHELFEAQVERAPETVAVVFGDEQLTYQELNRRANQVAHHLRTLGVGPEVLVGICLERSVEMVVGLLGILKAGGAYVPLDPMYPKKRLGFMLEDAQTPVLVTQQRLVERLPKHEARVVCLDTDWETIAGAGEENLANGVTSDNLAYVIYTSGSTGRPKGVLIPHRALVNHNIAVAKHYDLQPNDRILQFASISFDVAAEELFPSWLSGATVVLRPDKVSASLTHFLQFVEEQRLTVLNLPTPFWHEWVLALSRSEVQLPPTLRLVIVGSEKALVERFATWQRLVGNRLRWCNAYGPTEATITSTIYEPVTYGENQVINSVPIGRPIANMQTYVLDSCLQPVPIGVSGELCIGGAGLARGYLNRPERTAKAFIPHPFSDERGARLYRTGDLVRYLPDGNIEFLGRIDHQVKVRGFRIELGEIEAVLDQLPAVRETVVLAREDVPGDKHLVAYVVLDEAHAVAVSELRSFLKEKLPDYMVPSDFMVLEALPLTPNGKVDRRALPKPDQARSDLNGDFVAPRNEVEAQLAQIWEELLGIRPIGVRDNFFELGGHSLLVVRLAAQIEDIFGTNLSLTGVFQGPTIEQLAEIISQQRGLTAWPSLVEIQPQGSCPPFFCVHSLCGDVVGFSVWAHHLGRDQPFYGLRARGLDGVQEPLTQVEAIAADYIEELRTVQPEGPYYLGGYGPGSIIAFEMTQQLHAQGQEVALLAILNEAPPNSDYRKVRLSPRFVIDFLKNLPYWLNEFMRLRIAQLILHIQLQLRPAGILGRIQQKVPIPKKMLMIKEKFEERSCKLLNEHDRVLLANDNVPAVFLERQNKIADTHEQAMRNYVPCVYPGRVTVFRTRRQPLFCSFNPELCWGKLAARGVEVRVISGSNPTILKDPHARVFAEQLKACLDEAQTSA